MADDTLSIAARKLNEGGYRWMLVGSGAGLLYGRFRSTADIDIVLDCERLVPRELAHRFAPEFMLDAEQIETCLRHGQMFNAIPLLPGLKVDFVPLSRGPFGREAFNRRRIARWEGVDVWVTSPEDLVLAKLRWAKESGSERQLADVRAIMALGLFDESDDYFQGWVQRLDLRDTMDASRAARYDL